MWHQNWQLYRARCEDLIAKTFTLLAAAEA
jgi:hypothetical protein